MSEFKTSFISASPYRMETQTVALPHRMTAKRPKGGSHAGAWEPEKLSHQAFHAPAWERKQRRACAAWPQSGQKGVPTQKHGNLDKPSFISCSLLRSHKGTIEAIYRFKREAP